MRLIGLAACGLLAGCGPSTSVSVANVNAANAHLRANFGIAQPRIRSSWFAQGRPSNGACIVIQTPEDWLDDRNTLRFYYRLDNDTGILEPHRGPSAAQASQLDRDADGEMFGDHWEAECSGYAPFERRLTKIFGW